MSKRTSRKVTRTNKPVRETANTRQVGGNHYARSGTYQPWDVFRAWSTGADITLFQAYLWGDAIAYLARWPFKGAAVEDLRKCQHYLERLIDAIENGE